MKLKRSTGTHAVFDSIVELAKGVARTNDRPTYSISLEFALMELVRDEMRMMAQNESSRARAPDLLRAALGQVTNSVEDALNSAGIRIDLGKYERQLTEKLTFPGREIQNLGEALTKSRSGHKLGAIEEVVSDSGRPLIMHELGLREAIQGVLIEPTPQVQEIDVAALRERAPWRVEGEWFPYEVLADEFVFVIDDDGSIFVSTVNLPTELREKANKMIRRLADLFYK